MREDGTMRAPLCCDAIHTPLGVMLAWATESSLVMLQFPGSTHYRVATDAVRAVHGEAVRDTNPILALVREQLGAYFARTLTRFDIPVAQPGTPFQHRVWSALRSIPYGETRSYAEQARALGDINLVRAAASANGANRVAIIVPCHRVIGSDGSMTGFAGGLERKRALLALEGAVIPAPDCDSATLFAPATARP